MANVKRHQIEIVRDRTITETIYDVAKGDKHESRVLTSTKVERVVPVSYNVYFPGGHSVWFEDEATMRAAGVMLGNDVLVDTETGEPINNEDEMDLKTLVARKTTDRRMKGTM